MSEITSKKKNALVLKITKILVMLSVFCVVIFLLARIVIPMALNVFWGNDIPLIDDSSLSLSVVTLSESENAFHDLDKIKDVIDLKNIPEGKILAKDFLLSDTWDNDKVESLLDDNRLALQYFSDAANKQKFQSPVTADPNQMSQEIIAMNSWRQVAMLSCIRSIWLANQGRGEEALAESMKVMIIGDAVEKSQANMVTYLVGLDMKSNAIDTLRKIIPVINSNTEGISDLKNILLNYNLGNNSSPWKFEYLVLKNGIFDIAYDKHDRSISIPEDITLKTSYYFKPNLSIKELFIYYSKMINDAENPCTVYDRDTSKISSKLSSRYKWYFTENAVYKILRSTGDLALPQVLVRKCKIQEKYSKLISDLN